jgi:hypothetical protein
MSLEKLDIKTWKEPIEKKVQEKAIQALENGSVLYFPSLPFTLDHEELRLLSPIYCDPKSKNISYDIHKDLLKGAICTDKEATVLQGMIKRYALSARQFLETLIPHYIPTLIQAKTSFRPVEISGRKSSYRKDDSRLHVDSFPSNPTHGERILRVFTNINPEGKSRVWRLGEPFEDVVEKMVPRVSAPIPLLASLYQWLGITKSYRTPYDHYMLNIHDTMKGDEHYQKTVPQIEVKFPPGSSWIVFTDQVSHAAMSGQHVLEQTFHLPVRGIKNGGKNPLKVLEKRFNKTLI